MRGSAVSDRPTPDQAIQWLNEQLEELRKLGNASPRDAEFRQWRQAALTAVQRIWPDEPSRSDRFRRVPFTPNSSAASERAAREIYGKGWGEARSLLKLWIVEIETRGLDAPEREKPSKKASRAGSAARPTAPAAPAKSGGRSATARGASQAQPRTTSGGTKGKTTERLEKAKAAPAKAFSLESVARTAPDVGLRLVPGPTRTAPPAAARPEGGKGHERLKDMLGLVGPPRPADPPEPLQEWAPDSPAAQLVALASELENLEIAAADREQVRSALESMARHADSGELSWSMLHQVVSLVMRHPALARRAMPLILPLLEVAA